MFDILAWFEINKKRLIIGATASVIAGFAIYTWNWQRQQTELRASDALLRLFPVNPPANAAPPKADDFLKVATEFGGTHAASRALLLAAGTLFKEKRYSDARKQFELFTSHYGSSPFASDAAYGAAVAIEAQNMTNEAFTAYQQVFARYPGTSAADQAKLAVARIYESRNQPEPAIKLYDDLSKAGLNSPWATEATQRRSRLFGLHPHLLPAAKSPSSTNAPASTNIAKQS